MTSPIFAATEKSEYKKAVQSYMKHYNAGEYKEIHQLFSLKMMTHFPESKAIETFENFKKKAGNLKEIEFVQYNEKFAIYKGTYENTVMGINISLNERNEINGLFFNAFIDNNTPELVRNISKMILPFEGKWNTLWGGDTKEQNKHINDKGQKNAFDFLILKNNKSFSGRGTQNEDYYCFGKKVIAPCDAEVIMVVDGVKDNTPGMKNPYFPMGNTIILKTVHEEYIILAHFKNHTIAVKEGQKVKQGNLLGQCGNSGNSSEAQLHFHIQNVEDINNAIGTKAYFEKILVNDKVKTNYSPVKGDEIANIK